MSASQTGPELKMGGSTGVVCFAVGFSVYTFYITLKCETGRWDIFDIPEVTPLCDVRTAIIVILWFLLQCALYLTPVGGPLEKGVLLQNGCQLTYRINALFALLVNMALMCIAFLFDLETRTISGSLTQLYVSAVGLCFFWSVYLFIDGKNAMVVARNPTGNTGYGFYDWFMGRELNPRWRQLDWKYVMFRSGIIAWMLLNTCNLVEYWQTRGHVSTTFFMVYITQMFYVVDYFWLEGGVIVSRDIVHEGLGFNILLQFLMVPFCFIVQTRYIQTTDFNLGVAGQVTVLFLYVLGYYIYRASNSEKNTFRKNPNDPKVAHLKTMATARGTRLLVSGWWGRCRHPNYLGDICMSLSYGLATGFGHVIPYLGTLFLVMLLLDRERLDNADCRRKYGADWDRYCSMVKYRIVPGVY